MTQAKAEEKNSQADYETMMTDAAEKRSTDSKSLADKQKAKAETEASVEANTEEKAATTKTLMATLEHIQSLHAECDWLLQYFEVRKAASNAACVGRHEEDADTLMTEMWPPRKTTFEVL